MAETTRRTQGAQQGARSTQVVEAVLAAAVSELSRVGYAAFTIDAVAKKAGVNRTTIYRRWPNKALLLRDVLQPLLRRYDEVPDTGSSWRDLSLLLRTVRDITASPEGLAFTEASRSASSEISDVMTAVMNRALTPFHTVLARAVQRSELEAANRDMVAQLAFFGVAMWGQTHSEPLADTDCDTMAKLLLPRSAKTV